jgi:hypothetical protein
MDSLLRAMTTFSVSQTKTETEFDDMLSRMETLETSETCNSDIEWDILTCNYSKLRYLNYLMDAYDFPETEKFNTILMRTLESIDKKNQYYLMELDWDEDSIRKELNQIADLFEKSLNCNVPSLKLTYIIDAYDMFVPIIEDFRREKFVDHFDNNVQFVEDLNSLKKRRRID